MGDNDFTAGDPWGLPIEDSEELEIESARKKSDAMPAEPDLDRSADDVAEAEPDFDGETLPEDFDEPADPDESVAVDDSGWASDADAAAPAAPEDVDSGGWTSLTDHADAIDDEDHATDHADTIDDEDHATGSDPEAPVSIEDDNEFTPPARTPLSQMIAAAQSVVSSVQGDEPGDADESTEPELPAEYLEEAAPSDSSEDPGGDVTDEEPARPPLFTSSEAGGGDDDLPDEPPAWMIVEPETEAPQAEPAPEGPERGFREDDEPAFTPMDIEASIADLAEAEETDTPFAEDRFEMPGAVEAPSEEDFGVVDMDSAPGVYSELHDLADQDEQAEAMLQEAAEAFGRVEEPGVQEPETFDIPEQPLDAPEEDLDRYTEALAGDLETVEPAEATPIEDLATDLDAEEEDLDRYTEALAGDLETVAEETPIEIVDPAEEEEEEDLDRYADALTADLETVEPTEDSSETAPAADPDQLSVDELDAALAGFTGAPDEAPTSEPEEAGPVAVGWWDTGSDDAGDAPFVDTDDAVEETPAEVATEEVETVGWWGSEPDLPETTPVAIEETPTTPDTGIDELAASVDETTDAEVELEDEPSTIADAPPEPAVLIDSPVEWGTRYRQAHQGWVEDDSGRSTWRPIVTSGESVAGWDIDIYLGLVSGDVAIDPMPREDLVSDVADAREGAVRRMLDEALARGAHAIVGVNFSIEEVGGTVLVGAAGVAVTLRTPA